MEDPKDEFRQGTGPEVAERRQITVIFADLVDSTSLYGYIDLEDVRSLLDRFRGSCAGIIAHHNGHVAQYLGDGILAYFGYPKAIEDAAERAIRAALSICRQPALISRPDGTPLQARIGIASGLVVSGEARFDPDHTLSGATPNLAARLQALAAPGEVVVSESTRQLVGNLFELLPIGETRIKGFAAPQQAWKAVRESTIVSRFVAARGASLTPLAGREREVALLCRLWENAQTGNGHLVSISGEPGIGKSRLLQALSDHLACRPFRLLECQCSPYHRNSTLYPFAQLVCAVAGIQSEDSAPQKLTRLHALLISIGRADALASALMTSLLGIALPPTEAIDLTAAQRKEQTLAILEKLVLTCSGHDTTLFIVEDAHWIDPTSIDLLGRILERSRVARILIAVTHRTEWTLNWHQRHDVSSIACEPLGAESSAALVRGLCGLDRIADTKVNEIVSRCDGVPLFLEELTKSVLDAGARDTVPVPATLRDSLMARLDHLGDSKSVAQMAAVIGRDFDLAVLARISNLEPRVLDAAMEQLLASSLVIRASASAARRFSFRHALIQEEAYESLSRKRCPGLHRRVAEVLEQAEQQNIEPELVARHYELGDEAVKACEWWLRAAEAAANACFFPESRSHLDAALGVVDRIGDLGVRRRFALRAQLQLGTTLVMQMGPQVDLVEKSMLEARAIALASGADNELFQATWGLHLHAASALQFKRAQRYSDELGAISARLDDEDLKLEALHHRWSIAYFTGDSRLMREHTQDAFRRYQAQRHHRFAHVFGGHDLGVCAHCVHAMGSLMSGAYGLMEAHLLDGIALAESLDHPVSLAFAVGAASIASWVAGDAQNSALFAERLLGVARRYEFVNLQVLAKFMLGLFVNRCSDAALGAQRSESCFQVARSQSFLSVFPAVAFAEALVRAGRQESALDLVTSTLAALPNPHSGVFVPELWRLRGELTAWKDKAWTEKAEADLRAALMVASAQGAVVYRLRALIRLSQVLSETHRSNQARALLAQTDVAGIDEALPEKRTYQDIVAHLAA